MNKAFICAALIVFIVLSGLGALSLAAWLLNTGGAIGAILSPFSVIVIAFVVYKVCGWVCKHFIQRKK